MRLRTELRIFAACLIAVVGLELAGAGLSGSLPFLDPESSWQVRLIPAAVFYLALGAIRMILRVRIAARSDS